jgi:hypothetical protein
MTAASVDVGEISSALSAMLDPPGRITCARSYGTVVIYQLVERSEDKIP